jgi:hypothetical protein
MPDPANRRSLHAVLEETIAEAAVEPLAEALLSLELLRASHGYPVKDIAEAVAMSEGFRDDADSLTTAKISDALQNLLPIGKLSRLAKAYDLGSSYERQFHLSRVLTDIRPLFDDEVSVPPPGALIVHQLELRGFVNGELRTSYWVMNGRDLDRLKEQIERAQGKSQALAEVLRLNNISMYTAEKES